MFRHRSILADTIPYYDVTLADIMALTHYYGIQPVSRKLYRTARKNSNMRNLCPLLQTVFA